MYYKILMHKILNEASRRLYMCKGVQNKYCITALGLVECTQYDHSQSCITIKKEQKNLMIKVKNHAFQIYSLTFRLKTSREFTFLTDSDNWFHNLGAEEENERSNIAVLDLSTAREPFVDDLCVRLSVYEIGASRSEI